MVDRIKSSYPEDMICAEEGCLRAAVGQGSVWVIDPIDGTNNFVAQQEDFAVMLAYFENGVQEEINALYEIFTREIEAYKVVEKLIKNLPSYLARREIGRASCRERV